MTRSSWKGVYVGGEVLQLLTTKKKDEFIEGNNILRVKSRSTIILKEFVGCRFSVYNGKSWSLVKVVDSMVGYRLGEFVRTRKVVRHKIKK